MTPQIPWDKARKLAARIKVAKAKPAEAKPAEAKPAPAQRIGTSTSTAAAAVEKSHRRREHYRRLILNRPDIQGLRAIAVSMVVLYHLFPSIFPGGFLGVDVFFVISGFLIVGSLVKEATVTHTVKWRAFYARRFRRLMPAAALVLFTTLVSGLIIFPQTRWQELARDVAASALQIQNWNQIFTTTGYQSANEQVSVVQHFWTLSVEEQFYAVIPWLIMGAAFLAVKLGKSTARISFLVLAALTAASFIFSIAFTPFNHEAAYLSTFTRAWELGIGGLAAMLISRVRLQRRTAVLGGWVGLALVVASTFTLSTAMPIPGYLAAIPTLGAVLLLFCGLFTQALRSSGPKHATWWLCLRPFVFVGDISYSLYLWHWPLIVYFLVISEQRITWFSALFLIAASVGLAWFTYLYVELPFRKARRRYLTRGWHLKKSANNRSAFVMAGALTAILVTASAIPWFGVQNAVSAQLEQTRSENTNKNLGAEALDVTGKLNPRDLTLADLKPSATAAKSDFNLTSTDGCNLNIGQGLGTKCIFGDTSATKNAVLVGDSHAGQILDGLDIAAKDSGWKVTSMIFDGCPFTMSPPINVDGPLNVCPERNQQRLAKILELKPNLVIVSGMTPGGYQDALNWRWSSQKDLVQGYKDALQPIVDAGIPVSVVLDSPFPPSPVPDCLLKNGIDSPKCDIPYDPLYAQKDPLSLVAQQLPKVKTIDLTKYMCQNGVCPPVVGGVVVYRDNHLTSTFAKSLANPLKRALGW